MAEKPKGKWAEGASGYRPGSSSARGASRATRPWHVETPDGSATEDAPGATPLAWARTIAVDQIEPDPDQPRRSFDQAALDELAASLREQGVLQPLVVRKRGEGIGYIVVAGERRLRAARQAGLQQVPCMVLAGDSLRDARLAQLAENLQREDLAPMEEALAVVRLAEIEALSQEDLARRLGKSPAYISRIYSVSRIESGEYDVLSTSKPSMSVLYEYAQLPAEHRRAAADLIRGGATVRDLEELRGKAKRRATANTSRRGRPLKAAAPIEALKRAKRALLAIDATAARRLSDDDRYAILGEQLDLVRWAAETLGDDAAVGEAVRALDIALTRAFDERSSKRAGRGGRGDRKARSSRPR